MWALVAQAQSYYVYPFFVLNFLTLIFKANAYAGFPGARQGRETALLCCAPLLQTLRSYTGGVGNKTESVGYSTVTSWLTALQSLIPCFFYRHSFYVLNLDTYVNFLGYWLLITELVLIIFSCLQFADIRTQLTFVIMAMLPSVAIATLSMLLMMISIEQNSG